MLLILVVAIAVVAVAAVVVVNETSGVDIGGVKFNIPEKFVENANRGENTSKKGIGDVIGNRTIKHFDHGNDSIMIVVFETESSDAAKQVYNHTDHDDEIKTINGKEGKYMTQDKKVGFSYLDNNYVVTIWSTNETLLESVVP